MDKYKGLAGLSSSSSEDEDIGISSKLDFANLKKKQ
jgi:hypothetical protein